MSVPQFWLLQVPSQTSSRCPVKLLIVEAALKMLNIRFKSPLGTANFIKLPTNSFRCLFFDSSHSKSQNKSFSSTTVPFSLSANRIRPITQISMIFTECASLFLSRVYSIPSFNRRKISKDSLNKNAELHINNENIVTVVLLGWLGAKQKHLKNYSEWYNSRGINVITFIIDVDELLRFDMGKGAERRIHDLADELVSWVEARENGRERCLVFHCFSNTGWLVYGYILMILQSKEDLLKKIKGCVVDSGGGGALSAQVWAAGFSAALFKKSACEIQSQNGGYKETSGETLKTKAENIFLPPLESIFQSVFKHLFSMVLKFPDIERKLMEIVSVLLGKQPCPQLYLYSKADKVVPFESIESQVVKQRREGKKVYSYDFVSSPHVDHYRNFTPVYSKLLHDFMKECFSCA